jgi:1,4-alpha-glucan branching enzyme
MPRSSTAGRKRVRFELYAEPHSEVFLAGTFNEWSPTARKLDDRKGNGHYTTSLMLAPGRYEYKFVINGVWCVDPDCPEWVSNELGSLNSVLHIAAAPVAAPSDA